ncbi:magnesium/cobalt transporter CorA [Crenobacter cavernae]|uniref:Magnesium transport protein CorA n=1 Tax=Crenobacter cavernae TaxID=2290923 RepID=A0ABY0FI39_9NEIS|nr:magnesium/cobalt transporter CorA [Crenobacter cavernae]RXZ45363.1 magnesium and cobalt transport protein CorA [Crenobacter cavernae]
MRHAELKDRVPTLGEAPGTLLPVASPAVADAGIEPFITLIEYGPDEVRETEFHSIDEGMAYQPTLPVLWLNVYGLTDPAWMAAIGRRFKLHPLVLEDILNARQRPKLEEYEHYLFFASRVFDYDGDSGRLSANQVYLIVGERFVISFQTRPLGVFGGIRDRIKTARGLLRERGASFLAYSLIDAVVDDYFGVLDAYTARVDATDASLLSGREQPVIKRIHRLKHDALKLRRALLPLREALLKLGGNDLPFIGDETRVYLRDAYDHSLHLIESLESARDLVAGMMDIYLSQQSHRLNVQMRVLTVITIIFMPLTLIAGIYGMNFENMPELHWRYGYAFALALMAAVGAGIGLFFWRRRWL